MTTISGIKLDEDESIEYDTRPSWWHWPISLFVLTPLTFGIWLLYPWWRRRATRYIVTNKRVVKVTGRLSKQTTEFRCDDIQQVETAHTWFGRTVGVQTVTLHSHSDSTTKLHAMPNAASVVQTIRS